MRVPLKPTADFLGAIVISGLPEVVRDKYKNEIPYTLTDKLFVEQLESAMQKINWEKVPGWIRYPENAYQAFRREGRYHDFRDEIYRIGSFALRNTIQGTEETISAGQSAVRRIKRQLLG